MRFMSKITCRCRGAAFVAIALLTFVASARAQTETWPFDLETSGEDCFHTSATAVDNTAPLYEGAYQITLVEAMVSYSGFDFGPFDVTDQIPPENLAGEGLFDGPPPFAVLDSTLRYPDPPAPVTIQADIRIAVNSSGYGQVAVTNITLGTMTVDLGWPFGEVTVQLESVRVVGTVWVTPMVPGDLDGNGAVDLSDLATLLAHYGLANGAAYGQGDIDGDGDVDLSDLAALLANYGT